MTQRLKIAIQKKGRLHDDSFALLRRCGLEVRISKTTLFCQGENLPIDLLLVRDDDIPTLVMDDVCDLGIVGKNVLKEKDLLRKAAGGEHQIDIVKQLGFCYCRLVLAGPKIVGYKDLAGIGGKKIATSYPHILSDYLQKNNLTCQIIELAGSVEVAPRLGLADLICDLVSTGETLAANNLVEMADVFVSEAVVIREQKKLGKTKENLIRLLLARIDGVLTAKETKYIMFHAPKSALANIKRLLPGSEAPTIMPLEDEEDKVAVHVVSREGLFWETLENLKQAGANSILVLPIEKMLF